MKVLTFQLCDTIQNILDINGNQTPVLVAPTTILRPSFIPGNYSFGMSIGVIGVDATEDNRLCVTIKAPDGSDAISTGDVLVRKEIDASIPAAYAGFCGTFDMRNVTFKCEGIYIVEIRVNGVLIEGKELPVCKKGD